MTDTPQMTLPALRAAFAGGMTPAQLIEDLYRRIDVVDDPALFIHLRDKADLLAEARALMTRDRDLPLWGMPFVVKDNIDVAGLPTTAACPAFAYTPDHDAFVVARLRAAGALMIGKTNLDQFATGLVGTRSPYGTPRNAIDPALVPGGSSSGSGVAVGLGLVPFALGTDTAGSGRVPAALNGIVGLKPSLGALSASGVVPACRSLDTVSVFARSVADAYEVFALACAPDPQDAYSRDRPAAPLTGFAAPPRVGVPDRGSRPFFGDTAQAEMFDTALDRLRAAGAEIVEVDFAPFHAVARMLYAGAWVAERYTVTEALMRCRPDALHPVTARILGAAEAMSAADAFRGFYQLKELSRDTEAALAGLDLLCVPTIPTFYSLADLETDPVTPNSNLGVYTNFVNLLDLCGVAVPTGPRKDGRPGSVTILAPGGQDAHAAAAAALFEGAPLLAPPGPGPGEMSIAVCGAHMSGLPLNGELTRRGGRLIRAARSAAAYRLFALAGGPPLRPGLLRSDRGQAIELEVWALPRAAFGGFLEGIPAPLCIGQVALEDGSAVPGFLVEQAGTAGARDITDFGGWRRFLATQTAAQAAAAAPAT